MDQMIEKKGKKNQLIDLKSLGDNQKRKNTNNV